MFHAFCLLFLSTSLQEATPITSNDHIGASRQTISKAVSTEGINSSFEPVSSDVPLVSGENDDTIWQEQMPLTTPLMTPNLIPSETQQSKRKETPPRSLETILVPLCNTMMRNCLRRNRCDFNVRRSGRRRRNNTRRSQFCQSRCRVRAQACT